MFNQSSIYRFICGVIRSRCRHWIWIFSSIQLKSGRKCHYCHTDVQNTHNNLIPHNTMIKKNTTNKTIMKHVNGALICCHSKKEQQQQAELVSWKFTSCDMRWQDWKWFRALNRLSKCTHTHTYARTHSFHARAFTHVPATSYVYHTNTARIENIMRFNKPHTWWQNLSHVFLFLFQFWSLLYLMWIEYRSFSLIVYAVACDDAEQRRRAPEHTSTHMHATCVSYR